MLNGSDNRAGLEGVAPATPRRRERQHARRRRTAALHGADNHSKCLFACPEFSK
jgi:hypothetical protein